MGVSSFRTVEGITTTTDAVEESVHQSNIQFETGIKNKVDPKQLEELVKYITPALELLYSIVEIGINFGCFRICKE